MLTHGGFFKKEDISCLVEQWIGDDYLFLEEGTKRISENGLREVVNVADNKIKFIEKSTFGTTVVEAEITSTDSGEEKVRVTEAGKESDIKSSEVAPPEDDKDGKKYEKSRRVSAERKANTAYEEAKAGGKHGGFFKNMIQRSVKELQSGIKSLQKQIIKHQDKIINPKRYIKNWDMLSKGEQDSLLSKGWPKEIEKFKEQQEILDGILNNIK